MFAKSVFEVIHYRIDKLGGLYLDFQMALDKLTHKCNQTNLEPMELGVGVGLVTRQKADCKNNWNIFQWLAVT